MNSVDVLIVGAGPAGMSAAISLRRHGLGVMVVDDQPAPGGQIWRSVETASRRYEILGPSFVEGRAVVERFRASGAIYLPQTRLWQIEPGFRAFVSREREGFAVEAKTIILAIGAQERPVPFPGWTLPGVLPVGAAQILLKNAGQIPTGRVWMAGSGPLPLLYANQFLRAGGELAGYLDTTPRMQWAKALRHLPNALRASTDLLKGLGWEASLRRSSTPIVRSITDLEAIGQDQLQAIRYRDIDGRAVTEDASTLLVHEGVVPNIHPSLSMDCEVTWSASQDCFVPVVDHWGESSNANLFVVGDGAGIAGAKAAQLRGELAAIRLAVRSGRANEAIAKAEADLIRRKLGRELATRPFLDALFKPRPQIFAPSDETIVCRCEELTANDIRTAAAVGRPGPNQVKAATRVGMGPCQGRQCGYSVTRLLSEVQKRPCADVGFFHIRPPLKPVTLGELASIGRSTDVANSENTTD